MIWCIAMITVRLFLINRVDQAPTNRLIAPKISAQPVTPAPNGTSVLYLVSPQYRTVGGEVAVSPEQTTQAIAGLVALSGSAQE